MKAISRNLSKSGIYCIINLVNNKRYIGSSKNIGERLWQHRSKLRHNHHFNPHLQNAWNKYGEDKFDYYIIEWCEESIRIEREQFYVDTQHPEYNISEIVNLPSYSEESRKKHSETRKRKIQSGEIKVHNKKPMYKYDLNGVFLEKYDSIKDAARLNNINISQIYKNLVGEGRQGGGFMWSYTKEPSLPKYIKNTSKPCRKRVIVYNENEFLEFDNAYKCAEYFKVHVVTIRCYILYNRIFKKKYTIKYKECSPIK